MPLNQISDGNVTDKNKFDNTILGTCLASSLKQRQRDADRVGWSSEISLYLDLLEFSYRLIEVAR